MIDGIFTREPWAHQRIGVEKTIEHFTNGEGWACLTSPTGSGKTQIAIALTRWGAEHRGGRVLVLTNRVLLTEQTERVFRGAGVSVGVISSTMKHLERNDCRVQIATVQTLLARRRADPQYWVDADLVLADEVHNIATGDSGALLNEYRDRGAKGVGVTATPLGVCGVCDKLIVAGRTRDLQDQGILCYARWFAPSELDTRNLVKGKVDLSLTESEARATWGPLKGDQAIRERIVGNMLEHFERLHPERKHTLAFAPGVAESLWAAKFCESRGIRSLHVDGDEFWFDGQLYDRKANESEFQAAMNAWRSGDIAIAWNRFCFREGLDEPQIKCVLLATPVGSYRAFLQMVGRGLRTHESKGRHCIVIDFGGNWWRHPKVNSNVDWESVFDCLDPDVLTKNRIAKYRETGESLGRVCRECGIVVGSDSLVLCPNCHKTLPEGKPSRTVIRNDGTLTQATGEPIKQWKIKRTPEAADIWKGLYWNAFKYHNGEVSFNQLYQQFGHKTAVSAGTKEKPAFWLAYYPPRDLPLMPERPNDWHRQVCDVAMSRLR